MSEYEFFTSIEEAVALRTVPYFVWSNFEISKSVFTTYSSLVDLIPLLLYSVDMPLSPYFKTIIDLNRVLPIRLSTGEAIDYSGIQYNNAYECPYSEIYDLYLNMEYNNLNKDEFYIPLLFE